MNEFNKEKNHEDYGDNSSENIIILEKPSEQKKAIQDIQAYFIELLVIFLDIAPVELVNKLAVEKTTSNYQEIIKILGFINEKKLNEPKDFSILLDSITVVNQFLQKESALLKSNLGYGLQFSSNNDFQASQYKKVLETFISELKLLYLETKKITNPEQSLPDEELKTKIKESIEKTYKEMKKTYSEKEADLLKKHQFNTKILEKSTESIKPLLKDLFKKNQKLNRSDLKAQLIKFNDEFMRKLSNTHPEKLIVLTNLYDGNHDPIPDQQYLARPDGYSEAEKFLSKATKTIAKNIKLIEAQEVIDQNNERAPVRNFRGPLNLNVLPPFRNKNANDKISLITSKITFGCSELTYAVKSDVVYKADTDTRDFMLVFIENILRGIVQCNTLLEIIQQLNLAQLTLNKNFQKRQFDSVTKVTKDRFNDFFTSQRNEIQKHPLYQKEIFDPKFIEFSKKNIEIDQKISKLGSSKNSLIETLKDTCTKLLNTLKIQALSLAAYSSSGCPTTRVSNELRKDMPRPITPIEVFKHLNELLKPYYPNDKSEIPLSMILAAAARLASYYPVLQPIILSEITQLIEKSSKEIDNLIDQLSKEIPKEEINITDNSSTEEIPKKDRIIEDGQLNALVALNMNASPPSSPRDTEEAPENKQTEDKTTSAVFTPYI